MAEAYVEERHLLKALRWWDGFVIALCNPGFLIAALGFSLGSLGTWGAVTLWAISAAVGVLSLAAFHVWAFETPLGARGASELTSSPSRFAMVVLGLHLDQSQG